MKSSESRITLTSLPSYSSQRQQRRPSVQTISTKRRAPSPQARRAPLPQPPAGPRRRPPMQYNNSSTSTSHYPSLTRDRLNKKNRLDHILSQRHTLSMRNQRRRSISNGNIYRRVYNEGGDIPWDAYTNPESETGAAAGDSTVYAAQAETSSPNRSSLQQPTSTPPSGALTTSQRTSAFGRQVSAVSVSPIGMPRGRQKSLRRATQNQLQQRIRFPDRRVSRLLEMTCRAKNMGEGRSDIPATAAAAARALSSAVAVKTTWRYILSLLSDTANRVVDARSCEPEDARLDVKEMNALAQYFHVLQNYPYYMYEDEEQDRRPSSASRARFRSQPTAIFVQQHDQPEGGHGEAGPSDIFHSHGTNSASSYTPPFEPSSPSSVSEAPPRDRLGSITNLFPFRSASKAHKKDTSRGPPLAIIHSLESASDVNSDLSEEHRNSPSDFQPVPEQQTNAAYQESPKRTFMRRISDVFTTHSSHGPIHLPTSEHNSESEKTQTKAPITFQGKSLFMFDSNSKMRLFLWKVIACK